MILCLKNQKFYRVIMNQVDVGGSWICLKIRTQHLFEVSQGCYKNFECFSSIPRPSL